MVSDNFSNIYVYWWFICVYKIPIYQIGTIDPFRILNAYYYMWFYICNN